MNVFDLQRMEAKPYEEREKNVFYETREFKTRVVELPAGGQLPECEMGDHVIFYVLSGEAAVTVNGQVTTLKDGQCLISPPATFSMKTVNGVRLMGIQIAVAEHSETEDPATK